MNDLLKNPYFIKTIWSIITIFISWLFYGIVSKIITRAAEGERIKNLTSKKTKTYIKLIRSIMRYIFIVCTFLFILQIFGVNVSSVVAGVGVLGVIFGLAIQDFLKDIIRGSSILSDNYFSVGDVVKYKDIEGKVLVLGLKTTKIQDLKTSNIISIANRNIDEIQVLSDIQFITVPLPYEVSVEEAEKAIDTIVERVKKCKDIANCTYVGVNNLGDSAIEYFLKVQGNPIHKLQIRRDTLREILLGLEEHHISVPYTQIDIHEKK